MLWKINGFLVIPHELLHVAAYRMIGKRCSYQWGDSFVTTLEPCTRGQQLFCLLFPLIVSLPVACLPLVVWITTFAWFHASTQTYIYTAPLWHQWLFVGWFLLFTYVLSACFFDMVLAFRLLFEPLSHQPPDNASNH